MDNDDNPPIKRGSAQWRENANAHMNALMDIIMEHGHAIQGVLDDPLFAYTVGRTSQKQPEIYACGNIDPKHMKDLINDLTILIDKGEISLDDVDTGKDIQGLVQDLPIRLISCDPVAAEMNMIFRIYEEEEVTAIQLLFPDPEGKFPGEDGYMEDFVQHTYPIEQ